MTGERSCWCSRDVSRARKPWLGYVLCQPLAQAEPWAGQLWTPHCGCFSYPFPLLGGLWCHKCPYPSCSGQTLQWITGVRASYGGQVKGSTGVQFPAVPHLPSASSGSPLYPLGSAVPLLCTLQLDRMMGGNTMELGWPGHANCPGS